MVIHANLQLERKQDQNRENWNPAYVNVWQSIKLLLVLGAQRGMPGPMVKKNWEMLVLQYVSPLREVSSWPRCDASTPANRSRLPGLWRAGSSAYEAAEVDTVNPEHEGEANEPTV